MPTAFDAIALGDQKLTNRIVMSPMTRSRAYGPGSSPTEDVATYYAQRAGAGLIVTEGTQPNAIGQGYPNTPGLHSEVQMEAWRPVTDAVHAAGGAIYAQLMHTGRIGHPSNPAVPHTPVSPSPVQAAGQIFTPEGMQDFVVPRELTSTEIDETIGDFAAAARNAVAAGFDVLESRDPEFTSLLRGSWNGTFMLNPASPGSRTGPEHLALVEDRAADLVSFGQLFIANPDLPERLLTGAPLSTPDMTKAYGGDHRGYTDYPTLAYPTVAETTTAGRTS